MAKKLILTLIVSLLAALYLNPETASDFKKLHFNIANPSDTKKYGTEITDKDLNNIIIEKLHFRTTYIRGKSYWLPTKNWVSTVAFPNFDLFLIDKNLNYQFKFNCVDYSRIFESMSQIEYIETESTEIMQCVAIGEVHYTPDPGKFPPKFKDMGHSINLVILKDGEIMFFEPQNGNELFLSQTEINSIHYISF